MTRAVAAAAIGEVVSLTLALAALLVLAGHFVGCVPLEAKQAAAEDAYQAQEKQCVDDYTARADIDRCRSDVHKQWGIAETVHDAGADR